MSYSVKEISETSAVLSTFARAQLVKKVVMTKLELMQKSKRIPNFFRFMI